MRKILLLSVTCLALSGCGPELMFAGVAGTGATLSKEKSVGNVIDDSTIWNKIKAAFLKNNKKIKGIMTDISVEVSEGRVLLTGTADSREDRLEIVKIVWDQPGVKEVMNEIKVANGKTYGISTYSKDTWITTKVKGKFFANQDIRSLNYNVETIEGVVYLMGIARTETEIAAVINEAESVKGVVKVVSYVKVKKQEAKLDSSDKKNDNITEEKPKTSASKPANREEFDDESKHEIEIGEDD